MTTTIAELVVELGVKADSQAVQQLDNSVKKVGISATDARAGLTTFAKGVGAVGAVVAGAVAGMLKMADSTAKAADELIKGARRAGVSGQEFQRLALAAEEADVSTGALIKSSSQFAIMLRDAQRGDAGAKDFVDALGDIGLKFQDLEGLSRTQQFGVIADELNKVEDQSTRTAISAEIFGKRYGPELANLLATGSAGIDEVTGSLRNVFTDEQFAAAESYNDAVTEMKDAFENIKTEATVGLLPVMQNTVERITAFIDENEKLIEQDLPAFIEGLAEAMGDVVEATAELIDDTQALSVEFGRLDENTDAASQSLTFMLNRFEGIAAAAGGALTAIRLFSDEEETVTERETKFGGGVRIGETGATTEDKNLEAGGQMVAATNSQQGLRAIATNTGLDLRTRKAAAAKERQLSQAEGGLDILRGLGESFREAKASLAESRIPAVVEEVEKKKKKRSGRRGEKKQTLSELVNAVAGGTSPEGGGPVPNVAIAITNNNEFNVKIEQAFQGPVAPEDVGKPVADVIQRMLNEQNSEASRVIAPIVIR